MFFSIIVVCLNPGDKLKKTLDSIEQQSFQDYEIIIKDGISKDGSLDYVRKLVSKWKLKGKESESLLENREAASGSAAKIRILEKKDTGIYDAMNQAVEEAAGSYVYFLNCGDCFYSENVLEKMAEFIREKENAGMPGIFYGNIFERLTGQQVISNPHIDAFGCYRNVPCHQACFYDTRLVKAHPFQTNYLVRADYEQFLWCFFKGGIKENVEDGDKSCNSPGSSTAFYYTELMIADYEGGGFSETKDNRKRSKKEHKEITRKYIPAGQLFKFKLIMCLTLAPLRTIIAENEKTAGIYNRLKKMLYLHR